MKKIFKEALKNYAEICNIRYNRANDRKNEF